MRTEEGAGGGTVLFRQQILPWSCAWCKKRPRVEKQIALLQTVSDGYVIFLYKETQQQQTQQRNPLYLS